MSRFECDLCGQKFKRSDVLKRHKKVDHEGFTFDCDLCSQKFKYSHGLQRHKKAVHEGFTFECDLCGQKFKRSDGLQRHKKAVHEGFIFDCDLCSRKFKYSDVLKRHKKADHEGFRFECDLCGQKFKRSDVLKRHKKADHEGFRFDCDMCNQKFKYSDVLKRHKKAVHEEGGSPLCKKYRCTYCMKFFEEWYQYNNHVDSCMKKPLKCDHPGCLFFFMDSNSRKKHFDNYAHPLVAAINPIHSEYSTCIVPEDDATRLAIEQARREKGIITIGMNDFNLISNDEHPEFVDVNCENLWKFANCIDKINEIRQELVDYAKYGQRCFHLDLALKHYLDFNFGYVAKFLRRSKFFGKYMHPRFVDKMKKHPKEVLKIGLTKKFEKRIGTIASTVRVNGIPTNTKELEDESHIICYCREDLIGCAMEMAALVQEFISYDKVKYGYLVKNDKIGLEKNHVVDPWSKKGTTEDMALYVLPMALEKTTKMKKHQQNFTRKNTFALASPSLIDAYKKSSNCEHDTTYNVGEVTSDSTFQSHADLSDMNNSINLNSTLIDSAEDSPTQSLQGFFSGFDEGDSENIQNIPVRVLDYGDEISSNDNDMLELAGNPYVPQTPVVVPPVVRRIDYESPNEEELPPIIVEELPLVIVDENGVLSVGDWLCCGYYNAHNSTTCDFCGEPRG